MPLSTKPTIYIIDGLNMIRSFLLRERGGDEEALTAELIDWLDELGRATLPGSSFRLILDGSHRPVGPTRTGCVSAQFTEGESADTIIAEQAAYLAGAGARVAVVTSDRGLTQEIANSGVKTIPCAKFFNSFYK